jgi:type II secretory pathway predicted ATPase ExeA
MEVRDTRFVKEALAVARLALEADNPIAEITGGTGSGKSTAAKRIVEVLGAKRIACWDGISRHQLLKKAAEALGIEGTGAVDRLLMDAVEEGAARRMLVVDEANKLNWRALEALRYLADECNVAVVLVGTEFYERQFTGARTRELLLQLGRRIGAKRTRMGHLDRAETYSHILKPLCGDCADREIVTKFWVGCRKGNWGDGMELAQECRRLMDVHELPALNAAVLDAALVWTANRHAVEV